MTLNYELLRNMYPEWEPETSAFFPFIEIFVVIALFILVPYILIKSIEHDLESSGSGEIDSIEIDDWFTFRKTYQMPK